MPNTLLDTGKGILGGAGAGSALGPVGAVAGAIAGGAMAFDASNKMNTAMDRIENLPMVDPNMLKFQDRLERERRMVESGFTTDFQVSKDILKSTTAGGHNVAARVGQNNPALALTMMREGNRNLSTGLNKALGTISARTTSYTGMMADMIDKISQRKLDLEVYKSNVKLGQAGAEYKDVMEQVNAGIGQGLGSMDDLINKIKGGGGNIAQSPVGGGESSPWATSVMKNMDFMTL